MFCSSCGRFLEPGREELFCRSCGTPIVGKNSTPLARRISSTLRLPSLPNLPSFPSRTKQPRRIHSPDELDVVNRFEHIKNQIDLTTHEAELRELLNQSESLRISLQNEHRELANELHTSVAKKIRFRVTYVNIRESAKFAGKVISKFV